MFTRLTRGPSRPSKGARGDVGPVLGSNGAPWDRNGSEGTEEGPWGTVKVFLFDSCSRRRPGRSPGPYVVTYSDWGGTGVPSLLGSCIVVCLVDVRP